MKKFLSLIIWASFLFSSTFVNAYDFTNLWGQKFYYWTIYWELEKENSKEKTIFFLKEENWTIHQLFSSKLAKEIEEIFLWKNNAKILGQSYENPNNNKYAWIFVNKIWNLDIPELLDPSDKIKENKILSENQKELAYFYLVSINSNNKFLEWKKIFWDVNLKEIYKEMDKKFSEWEINSDFLEFIKLLSTDSDLNSKSDNFLSLKETTKEFKSLNEKTLSEIEKIWLNEIKNIFSKEEKNLSDSEKFFYNELKNIDWFENFLDKKIIAKKAESKEIYDFWKILWYKTKDLKIKFLFKNFWTLETIFSQKKENEEIKNFFEEIKSKILFTEICSNIQIDKNQNLKNSEKKLNNFLKENNSTDILKTALSKDFQSKTFEWFKINLPTNFDYQEIKIWNEIFSKIYLKDFYSNILSFDFNKVEKFTKRTWEKSNVKIAWNYWEKITSEEKIYFQIKNKSWEKFEISYSTLDKNFQEIFENILYRIWN